MLVASGRVWPLGPLRVCRNVGDMCCLLVPMPSAARFGKWRPGVRAPGRCAYLGGAHARYKKAPRQRNTRSPNGRTRLQGAKKAYRPFMKINPFDLGSVPRDRTTKKQGSLGVGAGSAVFKAKRKTKSLESGYLSSGGTEHSAMTSAADYFQLRAVRLLALALKLREKGNTDFADAIAKMASQSLDEAAALKLAQQRSDSAA